MCCNLLRCLLIDIGLALLDESHSEIPELLEIVGSIEQLAPLETEPLNIFLDCFYVFSIFFLRIGIIHSEVTYASILLCNSEVNGDSLGMTDVKVAVWFRRETGLYTFSILTCCKVFFNFCLYEVLAFLFNCFRKFHNSTLLF